MSYCECDSYAYPYRKTTRVAKKPHKCIECGRRIGQGDSYEYVTGKCEGDWFDCHTCQLCVDLREFVQAHVPCFCYAHGNVNEDAVGCAQEFNAEAPGLLFGALRRVVKINANGRVFAT